ncbi:MAG: hypothetical protein IKD50_01800 [Clostridia bacterium]|nr:hypothetical protein [Clostridia bacterium]
MAVYKADILDIELNTGNIARSFICHNIGKDDTKADRFGVRVYRDGEPESLSGCSIQGYMMRPNGTNLAITGSNTGVSGNEAWVDLPQAAYDYEGQFCLALKLIGGGVTGTIRIIDGMINNTFVDDALVPMQSVPTYQEILAVYDQMVAAKNGSVRFDQSQSLTETQKSVARMNIDAARDSDVSDLKSSISDSQGNIIPSAELESAIDEVVGAETYVKGFKLDSTGNLVADANCCVSDYIPISAGINADFYTGTSTTTLISVLYQADKTTIVEWYGVTNAEHRKINPLPANTAYARMTFLAGYNAKIIKTGDASTVYYDSSIRAGGELGNIKAEIQNIESEQEAIKTRLTALKNTGYANYTEGYWLDWHGYILENDAYCLSERIYIPGGTPIRFWCGESTDSICLVEYAADGTQIDTWGNVTHEYRDVVSLKSNTAFVRLSFVKGYKAKIGLANTPYVSSIVFYEANDNIGGALEKVPNYYFNNLYLQNKVEHINRLLRGCASNGDGFIFITDMHWGLNAKISPSLIDYIVKRTTINKVFDGGDRYDGYWPEPSDMVMQAMGGKSNYYPVVGNHEFLRNATNSDVFASAYMHLSGDVIWGKVNEFYYYFDNPEQKIRYICLQSFYENAAHDGSGAIPQYSSDELTWFENVALNVQSGWTILIFTHCAITGNDATKTATIPSSGSYGQLISIIENYTGNGEIACIIQGHFHWDYITNLPTSGIPVVVTTCDKYDFYNEPALADEQRTPGTIDEQAFDVVILDKENRKLSFIRIGDKAVLNGGSGEEVEIREVEY